MDRRLDKIYPVLGLECPLYRDRTGKNRLRLPKSSILQAEMETGDHPNEGCDSGFSY
jgi:hypothetical protein